MATKDDIFPIVDTLTAEKMLSALRSIKNPKGTLFVTYNAPQADGDIIVNGLVVGTKSMFILRQDSIPSQNLNELPALLKQLPTGSVDLKITSNPPDLATNITKALKSIAN